MWEVLRQIRRGPEGADERVGISPPPERPGRGRERLLLAALIYLADLWELGRTLPYGGDSGPAAGAIPVRKGSRMAPGWRGDHVRRRLPRIPNTLRHSREEEGTCHQVSGTLGIRTRKLKLRIPTSDDRDDAISCYSLESRDSDGIPSGERHYSSRDEESGGQRQFSSGPRAGIIPDSSLRKIKNPQK